MHLQKKGVVSVVVFWSVVIAIGLGFIWDRGITAAILIALAVTVGLVALTVAIYTCATDDSSSFY